jgi:hypothetical protein
VWRWGKHNISKITNPSPATFKLSRNWKDKYPARGLFFVISCIVLEVDENPYGITPLGHTVWERDGRRQERGMGGDMREGWEETGREARKGERRKRRRIKVTEEI